MEDPQQDSDNESDLLTVTKTSPMIIRLCTRPADMNMTSSENSQIIESGSSRLSESTYKDIEEINSLSHLDQKSNLNINLTMKDQTKINENIVLNKSLKSSKETACPYAKAKFKSVSSPTKSSGNINRATDNVSAKLSKTKSSSTSSQSLSDNREIKKETCKIEIKSDDRKRKHSLSSHEVSKDFTIIPKANDKLDYSSCSLKMKTEDIRKKRPLSPESISDKDLVSTPKAKRKLKLNDLSMHSSIDKESSNLSTSKLGVDGNKYSTISNQKTPKLKSKNLKDPAKISENEEYNCKELSEKRSNKPSVLSSSIFFEENTLDKPEINSVESLQICPGENISRKKKKHYRNRKTSSSSEESHNVSKIDSKLPAFANAGEKSSVLFKGNLGIEEAEFVGDLEIKELEQIREALKQQLLQNTDASPDMFQLNDSSEKIKKNDDLGFPIHSTNTKLSDQVINKSQISDEKVVAESSRENIKSLNLSFEEQSEDSSELCFVPKTDQLSEELSKANVVASPNKKKKATFNFGSDPEKSPVNDDEQAEKKLSDVVDSAIDQPPLVMQSSNLLFNDGLDNRHGGGGIETTREKEEPVTKKLIFYDDNIKDFDLDLGSFSINESKTTSPNDDFEKQSIQPDDLASNSTMDPLNSEENGLMEFDILDEFESDDNEPNESDSDDDSDLSLNEIDAMLEEGLQNSKVINESNKEPDLEHEEKEKVILKVRGRDHFDVLPEGWIEVTHNSGMPIYLHKQTRVCSVSKPYFLGPGSTRKHEIPVSAIPCLHYLRELEKENSELNMEENHENSNGISKELNDSAEMVHRLNGISENITDASEDVNGEKINGEAENNINVSNNIIPSAKLESVKDTKESGSLDYLAVREYCQKRFEFQTITVKRFRTWSGRRKHQKQLKRKQRPFLPDSTKLITCPLFPSADKNSTLGSNTKREFIMNPSGKSPVCILHEYVQHTLRLQPKYVFKELESANTPYGATVLIDDIEYGSGYGSSKKLAKSDAAKSALQILIPKMKMYAPETLNEEEAQDVEFFDQVRVEDPRVCDLSVKAGQPYPYQILLECLKRNYGMGDTEIEFWMKNLKHQKNEFFMKVGKHQVSVVCKNKRDGKHRASQAVLQCLHPHIKSWGSLLRMYGKGSCKTLKEKKEEEQRITELQSQACVNKPNMSILNKLKEEMLKYRERMISKRPIGKLIPERMEFFSTSNSNLNNVEL